MSAGEVEGTNDERRTHQIEDTPLPVLRSRRPVGLYALRSLLHAAALERGVTPGRVSFTRGLRVLTDASIELQFTAPDFLRGVYRRLLKHLKRKLLPSRRMRSNLQGVKSKGSNFSPSYARISRTSGSRGTGGSTFRREPERPETSVTH